MTQPSILICTVGTSLFHPNLNNLKVALVENKINNDMRPLVEAFQQENWASVAHELTNLPANERLCGAEINSIASLIEKNYIPHNCGLFFLHSDTENGHNIASILKCYYEEMGHAPVETIIIPDLQDQDPKRFRTKGLRNLARKLCGVIRERSASACAINATGGYKAQIAIGVLLGQAIGVPVYYKHELFSEIIAFPPMPIAMDYEIWMRASGLLGILEQSLEPVAASLFADEWDEKYESLVERVEIDDEDYLELSPTGQIFHDTFRERFRTSMDEVLPPAALRESKRPPRLEKSGWPGEHPEVKQFMDKITETPYVLHCDTHYYNPDLPERTRFRMSRDGIEGIFSDRSYIVKFRIETTAKTPGQQAAVVAYLNSLIKVG